MQKFIKKMKKGFTIMELVIVIAVIAILAAVLIPTFSNITENANESAAMQEANNEWRNYSVEVATNPASDNNFIVVYTGDGVTTYFEVIENQFNVDPISTDLTYTANSTNADATLEGSYSVDSTVYDEFENVGAANSGYTYENESVAIFHMTVSD